MHQAKLSARSVMKTFNVFIFQQMKYLRLIEGNLIINPTFDRQVRKKAFIENTVPLIISLKNLLEQKRCPALRDLMGYLQVSPACMIVFTDALHQLYSTVSCKASAEPFVLLFLLF